MLTQRVIACFDVVGSDVTKARQFQDNIIVGPAVELARRLYRDGIDEIIYYDIKASAERRLANLATVTDVAQEIFVPFTVGGGIGSLKDMFKILDAGAEKISIDSMAVRNPEIIEQGANEFGSQSVVLSMQVKRVEVSSEIPSGYEVAIDGARVFTGKDAVAWARQGVELGAGEICVNSIDQDGTHEGFDLDITGTIANSVNVPVIASGGAGSAQHLVDLFTNTSASAAIVSSLLYSPRLKNNLSIDVMKGALAEQGMPVRPGTGSGPRIRSGTRSGD